MRIARYLFVGAAAAAVDFSVYGFLTLVVGVHYLLASTIGFMLALSVNYALSIRFVFDSGARFTKSKEFAAVVGVSGVGLAVHQLVLYTSVDSLGIGLMAAKVIATASAFMWNYVGRSRLVFAPRSNKVKRRQRGRNLSTRAFSS